MTVADYFIFIAVGYLVGSVPIGLIAARRASGVDVRDFGSGKTGMTNVIRTSGKWVGAAVLLLDMSKAVVVIAIARFGFDTAPGVHAAAGLAALVGHNFPVFAGFRGGRGIATGWGGLFIFTAGIPWAGLIATAVGVPLAGITRYVSLGSMTGAVAGAMSLVGLAAAGVVETEYMWYGIVGAPLVVIRHHDNIRRLIRGEERRLGAGSGEGSTE